MANLNKVLLIGNVSRAPETRYTSGGSQLANFSVALNHVYTSNNERKEETTFVEVVAWGKLASFVSEYFDKGKSIFVEGRLQMSEWQDREGKKQRKMQVIAENVQFVGKKE